MWSVRTPTQDVDMKDVNVLSVIFDVSFRSGEAGRKCAVSLWVNTAHCNAFSIENHVRHRSPMTRYTFIEPDDNNSIKWTGQIKSGNGGLVDGQSHFFFSIRDQVFITAPIEVSSRSQWKLLTSC
jgi:hypothetical protein